MICALDLGMNVNFSEQKGNRRDSKCENSTTPCCWLWDAGSPEQGPVKGLVELTADFSWQPSRKQDLSPTNIKQGILPTTRKTSWTNPTSDLQNCEIIKLYCFKLLKWRKQWQPTSVLLPGKSHGQRSLVGCSHGVAKSRTWLSDFTFTFHFHALEKEMATHLSVLAWRIPGKGEPGGLPSMGLHRVGHDWSGLVAAAASCLKNKQTNKQT